MSKVREIHRRAMSLLDEAIVARMSGDINRYRALQQQAFESEREAAELLTGACEQEPTRSILFRSDATLALECGDHGEAERLTSIGLAGNPPAAIAQQLCDVQAQARLRHSAAPTATSTTV